MRNFSEKEFYSFCSLLLNYSAAAAAKIAFIKVVWQFFSFFAAKLFFCCFCCFRNETYFFLYLKTTKEIW
jgi:hypothetical protein